MKKKGLWILLLAVGLAAVCIVPVGYRSALHRYRKPALLDQYTLTSNSQQIQMEQTSAKSWISDLTLYRRRYTMESGDTVLFGRLQSGQDSASYRLLDQWELNCSDATVYSWDVDNNAWAIQPLDAGTINSTCIYVDSDTEDFFFYMPLGFILRDRTSLESNGSRGYLEVKSQARGYRLKLYGSFIAENSCCDYTVVHSDGDSSLIDTSDEALMQNLSRWTNIGEHRWLYDGYYRVSPDSYVPSGKNYVYRCVAAYAVRDMVNYSDMCRLSDDLCTAMLDTVSLQQTDEGFFATMPESEWLREDYGIGPGFYDTRFNSDLMKIYLLHYKSHGGFEQTIDRYFSFFQKFAAERHFETENGGWLVYDYYPSEIPVHISLNHQLSEIEMLYEYSECLGRPELSELADRMLLGIEDTADGWIREDSNLHYCIYVDGSYGKDDYPALTYNDMYNVQKILERQKGARNETLDALMQAKQIWMDRNGVTEYYH